MNKNLINNFWKINDKTILGLLFSAAKENPQKIRRDIIKHIKKTQIKM